MKVRPPAGAIASLVVPAFALDGDPGMHDPSTVIQAEGKFYVYSMDFSPCRLDVLKRAQ